MKDKLNKIIIQEIETIGILLLALEEQHKCVVENDIFGMEACVDKIKKANKNIAHSEVERRRITENRAMTELLQEANDQELTNNYYKIKRLLQEVVLQKDTNEMLIKQGLSFTNRILNVLNPVRESKTYNAYGKVKK
ncbi:flagellar protein FlgN [Clostridium bowmanii]|uniref:flagellar protein FlgN n=1 Tax=Clostridium bowmanii TaxID=132925 RepID=UPI001C0CDE4C|nr:flagellar protein FlgN [Clostridium bowmanii]MBU3190714.1 flagellar protein FlgN [Clostridium bowmanii]MCA1075040.1 flagellar protein FlgN [Clostridium bowmanii]